MESTKIQEIWNQHEVKLDQAMQLNLELLKEVKLDQAKSALGRLLFLPISTIAFFSIAAIYGVQFAMMHWETWYFAFSGLLVTFFSMLYVIASIRQLKLILSLDYNSPVLKLQQAMSKLKMAIVDNLRIAAALLPFAPFIGLFVIKGLFGFDFTKIINLEMIVTFALITVVLEALGILITSALRLKNSHKKWYNWLLKGNGSQVDEAINFLKQIKSFKDE